MEVSLASSGVNDFEKWSIDHPPTSNDDDSPGGATPIALVVPSADRDPVNDIPHRPWVVPGVGGSF